MPRHGSKLRARGTHQICSSIERLEPRRLLNAADLDNFFSLDGQHLSGDALGDVGSAIKRQDDGKLVVAGTSITNPAVLDYAFYVQRFNADGTLDTGFGNGGRVMTEFTPGADLANEVLVQSDGKIIALGIANGAPGANSTFALVRYTADGTPDGSFGTGGLVTSDPGPGLDSILGATLRSDGKIVVAGVSSSAGAPDQFTVARYLTDGTLDDSFGVGGVVVTPFTAFASRGAAVAIDADGKVVAVGTSQSGNVTSSENFAIARYNEDGSLDTTFDTDGKAIVNFENASDRATSLAIQGDGKILVAGEASGFTTRPHMAAARLNADGSLDTAWAGDGTLRLPLDTAGNRSGAMAVLVHSDGRVVLAGQQYPATGSATDFALVRLTETGELDPTFNGTGIRTLDFGGSSADQAGDAVFVAGEGIVMVGASNGGTPSRPFDTAIAQFKGGVEFATLRLGALSVVGTAGDDVIEISRSGQDYLVTRNGITNTVSPAMQPAGAVTLNVLTIGGNDTVNVVDLVRPGTFNLGAGDDAVTLSGAGVGTQPLAIDGAQGADTLNVPANLVVPVTFGGGQTPDGPNVVNFTGSDGDDTIEVNNASIVGAATSVGFSNIHSVNISARGGNDVINWANDRAATLDLGEGDDTINFNRGSFFAVVTVSGGAGDDVVVASANGSANVAFDPGPGTDKVIYEGRDFIDTVTFSKTEVAGLPIVRFTDLESLVVNGNGDDDDISGTASLDGPSVEINGLAGNDGITLTFEAGARATVNGGDGADALNLAATAGDDTLKLGTTSIGVNAESLPFTSVEKVSLNGAAGSDTIVYDGSLDLPTLDVAGGGGFGATDVLRLKGGDGADAFTLVNDFRVTHGTRIIGLSGINEIAMDDSAGGDAIDVRGSILVNLGTGQELASLAIGAEGRVAIVGSAETLRTGVLTIATGGRLDVGRGTLYVTGADIRAIEALMKSARDGSPRWTGPGVGTSASTSVTGLCAAEGTGGGVKVQFTYNGDLNLDGRVNADDYFRIDQAFLQQLPEPLCRHGDMNFDDRVNADDYFLIDQAFLGQGGPLGGGAQVSASTAVTAVPDEQSRRGNPVKPVRREGVWSGTGIRRSTARRAR